MKIGRGGVVVGDRAPGDAVVNRHADRIAERQGEGLVALERRVADDVRDESACWSAPAA